MDYFNLQDFKIREAIRKNSEDWYRTADNETYKFIGIQPTGRPPQRFFGVFDDKIGSSTTLPEDKVTPAYIINFQDYLHAREQAISQGMEEIFSSSKN